MTYQSNTQREVPEWAQGDPLMEWYATEVWGKRVADDDALFENMNLQIFQAGLNWRMILARRDAFREAFHGWRVDKCQGRRDIRPCGGVKVYHRDVGAQHECHHAAGVRRIR